MSEEKLYPLKTCNKFYYLLTKVPRDQIYRLHNNLNCGSRELLKELNKKKRVFGKLDMSVTCRLSFPNPPHSQLWDRQHSPFAADTLLSLVGTGHWRATAEEMALISSPNVLWFFSYSYGLAARNACRGHPVAFTLPLLHRGLLPIKFQSSS